MNDRIERLKTSKEAENLAANADRLGAPDLAEAARARAVELRAAERPVRSRKSASGVGKSGAARIEGECLYMNGVFESVLQEIEQAQANDPAQVCYLQPYTRARIKKLKDDPPSAAAAWGLFISTTTELMEVTYQAEIVEWHDKTLIPAEKLAELNARLAATQPGEGAVHLDGEKGKVGINLIGITGLRRLEPPIAVSEFKKVSDGMPLKGRTQAGGYSYVLRAGGGVDAPVAEPDPSASPSNAT